MQIKSTNYVKVKSYSHVFVDHITFYFTRVEAVILPFSYIFNHSAGQKWTEFNTQNRPFSEHKKWNYFRNNKDITQIQKVL